jgi:hypothetical protein
VHEGLKAYQDIKGKSACILNLGTRWKQVACFKLWQLYLREQDSQFTTMYKICFLEWEKVISSAQQGCQVEFNYIVNGMQYTSATHCTKHCSWVVSIPPLYSGCSGMKSWPEEGLYSGFHDFPQSLHANAGIVPSLLPRSLLSISFLIHHWFIQHLWSVTKTFL